LCLASSHKSSHKPVSDVGLTFETHRARYTEGMNAMTKVAYIRVSTTGQNLEAQREAVLKAGATKVYQDKASGKDLTNRPQLKACLDFLREGDELIVARLDRFARSTGDLFAMLQELASKKVAVTFLDNPSMSLSTAHGELIISILGAVAGFERRLILARTSEGREVAKRKGVKFGRKPVISAEVKAAVAEKKAEGELSMGAIAKSLGISRATAYRALES